MQLTNLFYFALACVALFGGLFGVAAARSARARRRKSIRFGNFIDSQRKVTK